MNILDLFSGIGGFSLAGRWAGFETVCFVEIDKFCQQLLNLRFPNVPVHPDIKTFNEKVYKEISSQRVDIITGGIPCQPVSIAGKRKGKADDRFLWQEMFRIIQEFKPSWVIFENVYGFITHSSGLLLEELLTDLEGEGFESQSFVIPSCSINAPHKRDRLWIVANRFSKQRRSDERQDEIFQNNKRNTAGKIKERKIFSSSQVGRNNQDASNSNSKRGRGLQDTTLCKEGTQDSNELLNDCHRLCGADWNKDWVEVATELCGVDARISNRVDRLKSLGNSIVPQIPYIFFQIIKAIENGK